MAAFDQQEIARKYQSRALNSRAPVPSPTQETACNTSTEVARVQESLDFYLDQTYSKFLAKLPAIG